MLPDRECEVFDLVYYDGLSQADAAKLLGIERTTFRYKFEKYEL